MERKERYKQTCAWLKRKFNSPIITHILFNPNKKSIYTIEVWDTHAVCRTNQRKVDSIYVVDKHPYINTNYEHYIGEL